MKMGRRLSRGRGIVTYRFRYAPLIPPVRLGPPCRRPILIATKATLFRGQDTRLTLYHPGIANVVMQRSLFRIEPGHYVSNIKRQHPA